MGFETTHADHIGKHFNPLTSRAKWKTRSQFSIKWIEPVKKKQKCFASNRIVFFAQKQKKVSNQAIVLWKKDLTSVCRKYNDETSTLVLEHD